jgi:catechol 2,3-dioxygenase-like lactoylglutathione lyase family enzyme
MPQLDHIILAVNDMQQSIDFYTGILGLKYDGQREPFSMIRVTPNFIVQLAPWGTKGGEHLAFSMTRAEFDATFARIREAGIEYGDSFHAVGNMRGPGEEGGAEGMGKALYFFDPSKHLIEIRHYEG